MIKRWPYYNILALAVLSLGLAGAVYAATNIFASLEAESGTFTGSATVMADTTAAGSSAVMFTTASPSSDFCSSFPALPSAKPDATNTGVPAGTTLTNYTGPTTITTNGTVIDGKIITSQLTINANNVTIRNSKVSPGGGYWAVLVNDGKTGTTILNSEIYSTNGAYTGISMGDGTVCGNDIHGFENAMTIGGNMTVQANYIHSLKGDGSDTPHYDGIEVYSGSNTNIWGNNIMMTNSSGGWLGDTGAINITTEWSNISNVELRGNWIGGGSYTLYIRKSSGKAYIYSNISVLSNRWYGTAPKGYAAYGPISDDGSSITYSGNIWDGSGQPL